MGWSDMNCLQRTARIVMIFAIIALIVALVWNCIAVARATKETWFTKCSDCKRAGGDKECGKRCCKECTWKDKWFFYIFRGFTIVFIIIAIIAEFRWEQFEEMLKLCSFYFPRGAWQIFLGLMTVQSNVLPGDDSSEQWIDITGYFLTAVGVLHLFLGCCCFQEYSSEKREKELTDLTIHRTAGPSQI